MRALLTLTFLFVLGCSQTKISTTNTPHFKLTDLVYFPSGLNTAHYSGNSFSLTGPPSYSPFIEVANLELLITRDGKCEFYVYDRNNPFLYSTFNGFVTPTSTGQLFVSATSELESGLTATFTTYLRPSDQRMQLKSDDVDPTRLTLDIDHRVGLGPISSEKETENRFPAWKSIKHILASKVIRLESEDR